MCEVECDGVRDRVVRQMGARRSDCTVTLTHTHTHTLLHIYNACDIYEQPKHPKKLELSTGCVETTKIQVCSQSIVAEWRRPRDSVPQLLKS